MAKLILSAFADEYSDFLEEQCQALNKFDIGYIEIRGVDTKNVSELTKEEVNEAKQKLDNYGIKVSTIGSPLGKIKIDDDTVAHLEKAKRVFETANTLGTKNVRMFSFYLPEGKTREDCKGQIFDELEKLIVLAEKFGVTLCHENECQVYGESPEQVYEIVKYFNGKLKCAFDMGNFTLEKYNPMDAYMLLKDYVEYFHIKDALYSGAIVPAGKGDAQIKEIIDLHKKLSAKDTFVSLEPHLKTFTGLEAMAHKQFDKPYEYKNQQEAFADGVAKFRELL